MYNILSIDGGGIRGVMPALLLASIEEMTGKPIASLFDLVAGTSTGAILAAGVTMPDSDGYPMYPAKEIVNLYDREGKKIFEPKKKGLIGKLSRYFGGLVSEKYDNRNLQKVLAKYFKGRLLSQTIRPILTCAYDIEKRENFVFSSHKARLDRRFDYYLSSAAISSAVAPTYFEPHIVRNCEGAINVLVDGGASGMNNPVLVAINQALELGYDYEDISVLSIGTGSYQQPISYDKAKNWGAAQWVKPLIGVMLDGSSELAHQYADKRIYRYMRVQFDLPSKESAKMDDASSKNMLRLHKIAAKTIQENSQQLKDFLDIITLGND